MGFLGRIGMRVARRSRWLGQRLWIIASAQVALLTWRHWRRLDREERRRLIHLLRKSRGRAKRLSERERREMVELLERLNYAELGGGIAVTLLPFRPFGRVVEFILGRPGRARRRAAARERKEPSRFSRPPGQV